MKKILLFLLMSSLAFTVACQGTPATPPPQQGNPSQSAAPVQEEPKQPLSTTKTSFLYSGAMKADWNYSIYLPQGYDDPANANKTYPVIYLLHGGYGTHAGYLKDHGLQERLDRLIAGGELPETIVVFPDGFISYYVNGPAYQMEDAIIQDLIPTMEEMYRIDGRKEARVIGGLSNGAYGASRFAIKYPELFSGAFLMSPAVWEIPENSGVQRMHIFSDGTEGFDLAVWQSYHPTVYFDEYEEKASPVDFYIVTGAEDPVTQADMIETFADKLSKVAEVEFVLKPGAHENDFWQSVMDDCLRYAGTILN